MRYGPLTILPALACVISACGGRQAGAPGYDMETFAEPPLVVQVEGLCEDVPLSDHCWKELDDPAGCYFWTADSDLKRGPVSWTGKCSNGIAEGPGVLDQTSEYMAPGKYTNEGVLIGGKMHGDWIETAPSGRVSEVSYREGKRHGRMLYRNRAGAVTREAHYVDNKANGPYVIHADDGRLLMQTAYRDGEPHGEFVRYSTLDGTLLAKGAYVAGKREGPWVESYAEFTLEGDFANGLRNGEWVVRHDDGTVLAKGSWRDDELHGRWTYRYGDGSVSQGAYLGGRRIGVWTVSGPDGAIRRLNYARRHGGELVDGVPLIVRVEGRCGDLPLGFPCWKELEEPRGCYWWSTSLDPNSFLTHSSLTWTGQCSTGIAEGEGTLNVESPAVWTSDALWRLGEGEEVSVWRSLTASSGVYRVPRLMEPFADRTRKRSEKGALVAGRRSGEWRNVRNRDYADHYRNGVRTRVVEKDWKGVVYYEKNFVDGKGNGAYVSRSREGTLLRGGNLVDDKKEGHWTDASIAPFGLTMEGPFANDLRTGEWTVTDQTGYVVSRGSFLDDEPHGEWTYWYRNGYTAEGAYERGERTGEWTVRDPAGNLTTVNYANGTMQPPDGEDRK